MRLPTLTAIVASQAIIWCLAGAYVHGPMILIYPLSWCLIGGAFYFHSKMNPIKIPPQTVPSDGNWANAKKPVNGVSTDMPVDASSSTVTSTE